MRSALLEGLFVQKRQTKIVRLTMERSPDPLPSVAQDTTKIQTTDDLAACGCDSAAAVGATKAGGILLRTRDGWFHLGNSFLRFLGCLLLYPTALPASNGTVNH